MEKSINIGDVIICRFPFDDEPSKVKIRPAVVMDLTASGLVVLVIKVTSKPAKGKFDYELIDWSVAGLHNKSTVRSNKDELILRYNARKK